MEIRQLDEICATSACKVTKIKAPWPLAVQYPFLHVVNNDSEQFAMRLYASVMRRLVSSRAR